MKICEIQLSKFNPRYNEIQKEDGPQKIINENINYNEIFIAKQLMSYEKHNIKNFIELIESLADGFKKNIDKPLFIKNNNVSYIVVEGNRRMLALKLLNGCINLDRVFSQREKIYQKMKYQIDRCDKEIKNELDEGDYEIIEENSFWPAIYTRHNAEARGKKPWSRIKYFYDLISYHDSLMEDDNKIKECAQRFNRPNYLINNDLKSARFIQKLIISYNNHSEIKIDPFNESSKNKRGIRASAFEPNNLINIKIKDMPLLNYLGIDLLNLDIKINNTKKKATGKYDFKDFAIFLIKAYFNKKFTTRGWNSKYKSDLVSFANTFGLSKEEKELHKTLDDAMPILPLTKRDSINNVEDVGDDIDATYKQESINLEDGKNSNLLTQEINKLAKEVNKIAYPNENHHLEAIRIISLNLFDRAKNLGSAKINSEIPYNCFATSIRSIWEHTIYYVIGESNDEDKFINQFSNNPKEKIYTNRAYVLFSDFLKYINDKKHPHEYENKMKIFANSIKKSKNKTSTDDQIYKILMKSEGLFKKDWKNFINEMIHSLSNLIKEDKFEKALKFLEVQISILRFIIREIVT